MWCHLFLAMPGIALVVFWFLPLSQALPIYVPVAVVSLFVYHQIIKAMRKPVVTGMESAVGGTAEIVSRLDSKGPAQYLVRYQGELWTAISQDELASGEQVRIVALRGIKPVVQRIERI